MRPLYIDGSPGCRVVLDEPALRVVPDKADQLFPLSRISRVVTMPCIVGRSRYRGGKKTA